MYDVFVTNKMYVSEIDEVHMGISLSLSLF